MLRDAELIGAARWLCSLAAAAQREQVGDSRDGHELENPLG
jgi:hypothetical protein